MKKKPTILVVNDDGVYGKGLQPLIRSMRSVGNVTVVVPDQERSADSHSLTVHKPLRLRQMAENFYILNGGPSDCVRLGLLEILKGRKADLVASGINHGYNLGEDVIYSGTVAAAMEATLMQTPAFAASQGLGGRPDYSAAIVFCRKLAKRILRHGLPLGIGLNVNIPITAKPGAPARVARLGRRVYGTKITVRSDPRGHKYFWLTGKEATGVAVPGSDVEAINEHHISVTPLHIDSTDFTTLTILKRWDL